MEILAHTPLSQSYPLLRPKGTKLNWVCEMQCNDNDNHWLDLKPILPIDSTSTPSFRIPYLNTIPLSLFFFFFDHYTRQRETSSSLQTTYINIYTMFAARRALTFSQRRAFSASAAQVSSSLFFLPFFVHFFPPLPFTHCR